MAVERAGSQRAGSQRAGSQREYDYEDERRRLPERRATRRMEPESDDREISLGTGTILGIFLGLAVTCGVFFGFGYKMGQRATMPVAVGEGAANVGAGSEPARAGSADGTAVTSDEAQAGVKAGDKPSANNPFQAAQAILAKQGLFGKTDSAVATDAAATGGGTNGAAATAEEVRSAGSVPVGRGIRTANERSAAGVGYSGAGRATQPELVRATVAVGSPMAQPMAATATGTFVVQVAAVSHQEDAELLDSALKQRGYAVFVRQEPQDHLLHVQVGPFASRRDADVVRQHLLADGYNALLK